MKKLLLTIVVLFTFILCGCNDKIEPYEDFVDYYKDIPYVGEIHMQWYEKGFLKNGLKDGETLCYNINTKKLWKKINYKNGIEDGEYTVYSPKGEIIQTGTMKKGKENGQTLSYYPDGKIRSKIFFEDDVITKAIDYDKNGKITKNVEYKFENGMIKDIIEY